MVLLSKNDDAILYGCPVTRERPLLSGTPVIWVRHVLKDIPTLLNDHAHCERKAAAFALGLLQRYAEQNPFAVALSKLAREEMRHFELVLRMLTQRGHAYGPLKPSNYARTMRNQMDQSEPHRLLDHLMIAALIEARSCERFDLLHPALLQVDEELARFYAKLAQAERRHYLLYFKMAETMCGHLDIHEAHAHWAQIEATELSKSDDQIRMHSGHPGSM